MDERQRAVRRPWLPPCLRLHGLDAESVQTLSYVILDETVDGVAGVTIWEWPSADGGGRLRFEHPERALEVAVTLRQLDDELYEGLLERDPRIGDVFAARVPAAARRRLDGRAALLWERPLVQLLGDVVYDVSREARKVAKLAFYSAVALVLPREDAEQWQMLEAADLNEEPAPMRRMPTARGSA